MQKLQVGQQLHIRKLKHNAQCFSYWHDSETDDHLFQCPKRARHRNDIYTVIKRLGKEMDPVLLEILLDGVTKYLTGTRQTKYITGINGKQKPDYWDRIHTVNGVTLENKEHNYRQLKKIRRQLDETTYSEASLQKTGGFSTGSTIESRMNINKKHHSHTEHRRKYTKLAKGNVTDTGTKSKQWKGKQRKAQEAEQPKPKKYKADVFQRVFK